MEQSQLWAHGGSSKVTREELKVIPTPAGSATHQPLPHFEIVGALVETLRRALLTSSATFHDFGSLVLGHNPLHLQ